MVESMLKILKRSSNKKIILRCPTKGVLRKLSDVDDPTFQAETLGRTLAIDPEDNTIYAPVTGVIRGLFPTCQSINIKADNGCEILLHIGIHTHLLNGSGFMPHVHKGDHVKAGEKLLDIDRDLMRLNEYDPVVLMIITNSGAYKTIQIKDVQQVEAMDELIELEVNSVK